jgi:U3 small nucleolar RNA-associated protein 4
LLFTPDGSRLVLGLAASAQVVVLDLPRIGEGEGEGLRVSKCFLRDERTVGGRVIKSIAGKAGTEKEVVSTTNGSGKTTRQDQQLNGYAETSEDDEDNEDEDEQRAIGRLSPGKGPVAWISSMAASDDGQWLAVSDLEGKVSVFNLDTLQVSPLFSAITWFMLCSVESF